ncbi:MAG: hypothetical protein JXB35_05195 [Anaerolineae bacterium]|nr:hypothetical protein [Anaerolineae bacterium]
MTDQKQPETKAVKMQKLRRAVDRVRRSRPTGEQQENKESWLRRIGITLGLTKPAEPAETD